jgi:hypothetical protein
VPQSAGVNCRQSDSPAEGLNPIANKRRNAKLDLAMDEGRKRVLAIVAGILVARHLKSTEDLFDHRASPRTEAMVAAAVQWADRIMRKIDSVFGNKG